MAVVGLIVHQGRPEATAAARDLSDWLQREGHKVRMPPEEAAATACPELAVEPADFLDGQTGQKTADHKTDGPTTARSSTAGVDVVVTLGGDGSILRAVELIGEAGVPILGVNFGRMGYLTEVAPGDARAAIDRVLSGDHGLEERMLLAVDYPQESQRRRCIALNEAVVERPAASYALRLGVSLDRERFTTYAADGLIVATPTGSTAYSLSARGPVVDPTHRALLLTPVSPHMLFDRSLVVDAGTELCLEVVSDRGAVLSVDGRRISELHHNDTVVCAASAHPARLVTFGARRFHQVLKTKFGLNDR